MDNTLAIQRIQTHWRAIEGIRPESAPDEPTDAAEPLPRVLTYEAVSESDPSEMYGDEWADATGTFRSDLFVSRTGLADAIARGRKMCKAFQERIRNDPNLGGAVMIVRKVRATFMTFNYGGVDYLGYRVDCEFESELTG